MKKIVLVLSLFAFGCAFRSPPLVQIYDGPVLDNAKVATIQLASHPGKAEGGLVFEEINGVNINEIDGLRKKGYYYKNSFDFITPTVIQLLPGDHEFLLRFQFIGVSSMSGDEATLSASPCLIKIKIEGKAGMHYVVDWVKDGSCVKLVIQEQQFTAVKAL